MQKYTSTYRIDLVPPSTQTSERELSVWGWRLSCGGLFIYLFILFKLQSDRDKWRGRERERERWDKVPSAGPLIKCVHNQGWWQSKSAAWSPVQCSAGPGVPSNTLMWVQKPKYLSHPLQLSRASSRKRDWKLGSQKMDMECSDTECLHYKR